MPLQDIHEKHINLNVRGLPLSATIEINERSNQLLTEGRTIYKLGLGQSPFPVPQPVVEELRANAHQKEYLPVKGLMRLRETVADYYCRTQEANMTGEQILIGPGSKELMFLLQLVYYGDLVIPTPSWVSYAPQAHIIGRHVHWLQTLPENDWLLTPEEIERHCAEDPTRPRIFILNYPNNPTGLSYSDEQLQQLAEVARKYRLILLSDEIYGELNYSGRHCSIARHYPEGTIISSGLSKWCGAGGWRLGTFAFPKGLNWLLEGMAVVASETFTATSAPIQYAAVRAFEGGTQLEEYLWRSRRILQALCIGIFDKFREAGIKVSMPDGAFYIFPDFSPFREKLETRGIETGEQLCKKLLDDTGVAILPGSSFGRPTSELTARLAFVDFDGARALAAAEQQPADQPLNGDFLSTYCSKVITAVDKICDWLK